MQRRRCAAKRSQRLLCTPVAVCWSKASACSAVEASSFSDSTGPEHAPARRIGVVTSHRQPAPRRAGLINAAKSPEELPVSSGAWVSQYDAEHDWVCSATCDIVTAVVFVSQRQLRLGDQDIIRELFRRNSAALSLRAARPGAARASQAASCVNSGGPVRKARPRNFPGRNRCHALPSTSSCAKAARSVTKSSRLRAELPAAPRYLPASTPPPEEAELRAA